MRPGITVRRSEASVFFDALIGVRRSFGQHGELLGTCIVQAQCPAASGTSRKWLSPCTTYARSKLATMPLPDAPRKFRFATWGKRLAIALATFFVLFMIASNVILRTRLFRDWMAFDPESMTMEYDSAYSWFPGRVHVENLRIRGSDSHVQWYVTIAHADTFMNPFAFARRRFSASHAHADGVTFRLRSRFLPDEMTPELLASLPKIPGFADPPFAMPVPPDPADPDYVLWSVDLEDVTARNVTDVWIDVLHETGNVTAHGRWLFRPLRELDFGPSTLDVPQADVKMNDRELAENVVGTAELRIFSYDVRRPKGFDLLRQFSGDAKLSWRTPLAESFAELVEDTMDVRHGDVAVRGELRLERGVLASGTRVHADVEDLDAKLLEDVLGMKCSARSEIVVDDSGLFSAAIESGDLQVEKQGAPPAASESALATFTSRHLDLAHGFDDTRVRLRARGLTTQSLEKWIAPSDRASAWATGTLRVTGDLESEVAEPDFHGHLDVAIHDASFAAGPVRAMSAMNGALEVEHLSSHMRFAASVDAHTPEPVLTMLGDLRVRSRLDARGHVDARLGAPKVVEISNGELTFDDARADFNGKPLFVAPSIAIRASHVVARNDDLEGTVALDAPRIDLPSLAAFASIAPFPASTRVVGGTATANAGGSLDLKTMAAQGDVELLARNVDVRIDDTAFFGNLQLGAHAVRRGDGADLSGSTIVLARGDDPRAPRGTTAWSATLTLSEARLVNAGGPAFFAKMRGMATDASPATLFVSSETGVPAWITNAFRMRGLRVTGEVIVAPQFFAVRSLDARGEDAFVDLEYSRRGPMKDGALYLGTGILTGGIDLAGGSARLVPLGAQSWFLRDVEKIRANEISLP